MLLHVKGSNKAVRKLVEMATWFYIEKLVGKRLMRSLEIDIKLDRTLAKNHDMEGSCIFETNDIRPREFTIEIDSTMNIRNILITLAHEIVHLKQWAKDEMYEYVNSPKMVRFKGEKMHTDDMDYWDYPWEIEAYGRQLGLFIRFCKEMGLADREDMMEEA